MTEIEIIRNGVTIKETVYYCGDCAHRTLKTFQCTESESPHYRSRFLADDHIRCRLFALRPPERRENASVVS